MSQNARGPKRPRNSRWARLPATYRSGEQPLTTGHDLQRVTLYLPASTLDLAEAQVHSTGAESLQAYCESLLLQAITRIADSQAAPRPIAAANAEDWTGEIDWDPASLAEWSAAAHSKQAPQIPDVEVFAVGSIPESTPSGEGTEEVEEVRPEGPQVSADVGDEEMALERAARVVLRHAALAEEAPDGLIACLRRGDPVLPGPADELLRALVELERLFVDAPVIDRRLAFALHRLAFEGQILLTDAWLGVSPETGTVETLRLVQEAVDRVLSGEDIRYYRDEVIEDPPDEDD